MWGALAGLAALYWSTRPDQRAVLAQSRLPRSQPRGLPNPASLAYGSKPERPRFADLARSGVSANSRFPTGFGSDGLADCRGRGGSGRLRPSS